MCALMVRINAKHVTNIPNLPITWLSYDGPSSMGRWILSHVPPISDFQMKIYEPFSLRSLCNCSAVKQKFTIFNGRIAFFFLRKYFDNFHQNTFNWGLLKCTVFEIEAEQFFASHCLTDFIQNRIIHLYHFDFCLNGFMGHFPTIRTFREVMLQDMHHLEWQIITCVIHFYHSYANYTDTHFAFTLNRHESAKLLKYTLLSTLLLNVKNFTKCE